MAIRIPQPSMALNDAHMVTSTDPSNDFQAYLMWQTWLVAREGFDIEHLIGHVANMADRAPDNYLRVVILWAHGNHAYTHLGPMIGQPNYAPASFARWQGKVANLWLRSCQTAGIDPNNNGLAHCSRLAKLTGAYVVASQDHQSGPRSRPVPWGHIHNWTGRVLRFEPVHGSIDMVRDYGPWVGETNARMNHFYPPTIGVPPSVVRSRRNGSGAVLPSVQFPPQMPWWR